MSLGYRIALLIAFAIACVAIWGLTPSPAADTIFWVDKYVDPFNPQVHCCSAGDCRPIDATVIKLTPKGWLYTPLNESYPFSAAHVSEDGRWWICLKGIPMEPPLDRGHLRTIRCLFHPPADG